MNRRHSMATALGFCAALLLSASPVAAGPIFLTGHDPDFHAHDVPGPGGQDHLLETGLNFALGGGSGKILWVEAIMAPPSGHRIGANGLTDIGLVAGVDFDVVNGAMFATVDLSLYDAIGVASSFGGLLTRAELDALIAREADIAAFINAGNGLFASSECYPCGADLLAGPTTPDLFGYLPISVTSIGATGSFTVTPYGMSLGLMDGDMNFPTHNSFGATGGLNIVDIDSAGAATTLAGVVRITDGGFDPTPVPEPSSLILVGSAALGLLKRARSRKRAKELS
jgi:hypothetical protein